LVTRAEPLGHDPFELLLLGGTQERPAIVEALGEPNGLVPLVEQLLEALSTLDEREMQYLYKDGDSFHFMDTETYEQFGIPQATVDNTVAVPFNDAPAMERRIERLAEEGVTGDIYLFKNNTDSAGNSYGCHENYLVGRHGEFSRLADVLIPFLVTRQIVVGAGKGLEGRGTDLREVLRAGASDELLDEVTSRLWTKRADRYSETRSSQTAGLHKVEMSYLGG
jgi:hypothetical protein